MTLWPLKPRSLLKRKAGDIYGAIVTQARQPDFYARLGTPDTPEGRYETVVVHLFLVLERLRGTDAGEVPRALVETFVDDMDDSMRELGTGDVGVGKKVQRATGGLYERTVDYRRGLEAADDAELARTLGEHVLGEGMGDAAATSLARYVRAAVAALSVQPLEEILSGGIDFPAPAAFAVGST